MYVYVYLSMFMYSGHYSDGKCEELVATRVTGQKLRFSIGLSVWECVHLHISIWISLSLCVCVCVWVSWCAYLCRKGNYLDAALETHNTRERITGTKRQCALWLMLIAKYHPKIVILDYSESPGIFPENFSSESAPRLDINKKFYFRSFEPDACRKSWKLSCRVLNENGEYQVSN